MIHFLPLSSIEIGQNRQRRFFDPGKLAELTSSIETVGLLQPIVIRDGKSLVCGERRLRAIGNIFSLGDTFTFSGKPVEVGMVPCVDIGDLDERAAFEAELDENIRRQDLTWQEQAEAIRRLHTLRSSLNPSHTIADTAVEVYDRSDGYYQDTIRKQLIVSNHLDRPEIAKAKSVAEAFKILKRKERDEQNITLGQMMEARTVHETHQILKGDCLQLLDTLPPGEVDCIITDPPYGINASDFGDSGGTQPYTHEYKDDFDHFVALMQQFALLTIRATKPQSHLFLWCDIDRFLFLRTLFSEAGWHVHRTPIIQLKPNGNRVPWPKIGLQRKWEMLLFAERGGKPLNNVTGDFFSATGDENLGHGAQKPVSAYSEIIKRACHPGDLILDPFAGTGSIIPAAHEHQCRTIVIEQSDKYLGIIAQRLESLK